MQLSRGQLLLLAGLAVAYAVFIAWYHAPYAGSSDASGYLNSAQLLLEGRLHAPLRIPAGLPPELLPRDSFVPMGFTLEADGKNMVPTYPVGVPLHLVALAWLTGLPAAATILSVVSALAMVGLLYLTARAFDVRPEWSVGLAVLGALSPLTLTTALVPMSDLLATVWALAVMLCARRASGAPRWAAAAGASLAIAVLVRPTNLLLALPALVALPARPRTWLAFALGGLPGALFLAWYNHALYGAIFMTGYTGFGTFFAWQHVVPTVTHYARWVPVLASPLVIAALALPWAPAKPRTKLILVTWAGGLLAFYATYRFTHETWWFLRFILPALPALGIAAALSLQSWRLPTWFLISRVLPAQATAIPAEMARGRLLRAPLVLLAGVAAIGWMVHWTVALRVTKIELDDRGYLLTGRWAESALPDNAVLLASQLSGALRHYSTRPFVAPNWLSPQDCSRLEAWLTANHRPLYAALYPHEEAAVREKFPGQWESVARFQQAEIWRRLPGAAAPPR